MPEIQQQELGNEIHFRSVRDKKFKTFRISANFLIPMRKDTAAEQAMLPFLLTRASREYPDFTKMSEKMASLYGATVTADVGKLGDAQVLTFSASGIADRYALDGESVSRELARVLCGMLFDPVLRDGCFPEDGFLQEQRQTLERIDAEYNDKRTYAFRRCQSLLFAGEPAGLSRFGGRKAVEALRPERLVPAWELLLKTGRVELLALGDCDPDAVAKGFEGAFQAVSRAPEATETLVRPHQGEVKDETDRQNVAQGKLVIGFRTGVSLMDEQFPAMALMNTVFGGSPSSKLFLNVREKLSLCYYCGSVIDAMKGAQFVQSGVETQNFEAAKEEILRQMDLMKQGEITEEELNSAKLSMANSYRTAMDSLGSLENWYLGQTYAPLARTPLEYAERLSAVTLPEVVAAAQKAELDTIYRLTSNGEAET